MLVSSSSFKIPTQKPGERFALGCLHGASLNLAISEIMQTTDGLLLIITPETAHAHRLERELQFFNERKYPSPIFPDWEILPYDNFSPHPDIISERIASLYQLRSLKKGALLTSVNTLLHRLAPQDYLLANSFSVKRGQLLDRDSFKLNLEKSGYHFVTQVMAHGEYAIRGSIIDVFPMGSDVPYRMDLFDQEIDTLRSFDPETQRTLQVIEQIQLLPAHEFPLTENAIAHFRQQWRERFAGNPLKSPLYESVSKGQAATGIEYYLPLFFEKTQTLFDYLPNDCVIVTIGDIHKAAQHFWEEINTRYEQLRYDPSRPILPPLELFQPIDHLFGQLKKFPHYQLHTESMPIKANAHNFATQTPVTFQIDHTAQHPLAPVQQWLANVSERVLFCAETVGRREVLTQLLNDIAVSAKSYDSWTDFLGDTAPIGMIVAPLEDGLHLVEVGMHIITESQLFGKQVAQRRLRKKQEKTIDAIVRDLTELKIGSPVVHIDHGVGRYAGLETIKTGDHSAEYLVLLYQNNAKLYVPISSLHLIGRYTGLDTQNAPLHKLGSEQWERTKRKASEKIRDIAAELLNIYARRAAKTGFVFQKPDTHYAAFETAFAFETTPDQQKAIDAVIEDMTSPRCMDRIICGDVGFGKTEVAMRAAFLAVQSNRQVAVLVPTTLLAEQHLHNFQDRFAKWPIRIEALSRFRSAQEQASILKGLAAGNIDIVIGTHKLLQSSVKFKSLGLLIIDEEHRFGVTQKERIRSMRAEIDLLALTATPIPRTLNMALASIRDLSIIATPPARRLSVKTFVREYNKSLIREAVMREALRGGQVYFLHNEVETIERIANELQALLPETRLGIAHGQMRESKLERVMADFYHQRFNLLVCTTIIESGIDIPTANTIIIRRADRFGLAQLHQLRGRVGRSHHQAYAYLLTPENTTLNTDAKKRLAAIESLDDLGSGFLLATQDLEIRGAGELLGEEQSGHIQELGFSLYMSLLETTVGALKSGKEPSLDQAFETVSEIDFKVPALIPDDYLADVHTRLILYKRISNAKDSGELDNLQAEMIDRFGLLPVQTQNLFKITELKLFITPFSIKRLHASQDAITFEFLENPALDTAKMIDLIQKQPQRYKLLDKNKLQSRTESQTLDEKIKEVKMLLEKLR
jgi:transcription-repair coupling factor (superfamily II helicase)